MRRQSFLSRLLEAPHSFAFRKVIFDIHQWCGVALAFYLILICITGVALVFREEMESTFAAQNKLQVGEHRKGFSALVKAVETARPPFRVTGIINSFEPSRPVSFYAGDGNSHRLALLVDQYRGVVLGSIPENPVLKFLQELHFNLLLERNGRTANAVGGLLLCSMCGSGLMLWWKGIRNWTRGLTVDSTRGVWRLHWDLHHAAGFWMLPLIFVWGLSGFYFGFRTECEKALNCVFPVCSQQRRSSGQQINMPQLSLDELVLRASRAAPGEDVARLALPTKKRKDVVRIWFSRVNSWRKDRNTEVDIDGNSGEILSVSSPDQRTAGDLVLVWLTRLHCGTFGGAAIKSVWCVLGLSPAVLAVTGLFMWWHRALLKKFKSNGSEEAVLSTAAADRA